MSDRKLIPGKFVWFEHVSRDAKKAQAFYGEVLGWKVVPFPMGQGSYEMIYAGETMIGGYGMPRSDRPAPHWASYVSVEDVDAAVKSASAAGGKVIDGPFNIPNVARTARIADPQGAEICLFKSDTGDPADAPPPVGGWIWNELHTRDPAKALAFYETVVGFTHRSMDMGPAGTYHVLSKGGVERGGVSPHLLPGAASHWLPYVHVDDVGAVSDRARRLGGSILMPPEDIPDVGRISILKDPIGAAIAIIKPLPREKAP